MSLIALYKFLPQLSMVCTPFANLINKETHARCVIRKLCLCWCFHQQTCEEKKCIFNFVCLQVKNTSKGIVSAKFKMVKWNTNKGLKVPEKPSNFMVTNPVTDNMSLFLSETYLDKSLNIHLINMLGQEVENYKSMGKPKIDLACPGLKPGIYYLKVCYDNGCDTKKIIIMNSN